MSREFIKNLYTSGILDYKTNSQMLIDWIFNRLNTLTLKNKKDITTANWKAERDTLLYNLSCCLGMNNLPKRTKINCKTLGTIEKNNYIIEKIIYESFKEIFVPAHLYIPKNINFPAPAILNIPGHWIENSKMEPDIQRLSIGLTQLGFVVLTIDPLEQGERRRGWRNHIHMESLLVGITQVGMNIFENLEALDYLESRTEVDNTRIGMVGTSGGGENTIYTSPFDERIKAIASVCYAVTYEGLLRGQKWNNFDGGADLCDQVPGVLNTLTFAHLIALSAPKPVVIISAENDLHFPLKYAREVFEEAKPFFDLYKKDLIRHEVVSGGHGQGKQARESIYSFFAKNFLGYNSDRQINETFIEIEEAPCQINYMDATADRDKPQSFYPKKGLKTYVFDSKDYKYGDAKKEIEIGLKKFFLKISMLKYKELNALDITKNWAEIKKNHIKKLNEILVKTIDHSPLQPKIISTLELKGYFVEKIVIESEDGITIPGLLFLPDKWDKQNNIWLCLDDLGKKGFINNELFMALIQKNQAIYAIDLRGQGETLSSEFEVSTMSYMLDRNLFSQRIFDILRAVEYISTRATTGIQLNKQKLFCYGKGMTALLALYSGAVDERIAALFLENLLVSYRNLLEGDSRFSASIFLFDILSYFDIIDILTLCVPKSISILNPIDRSKQILTEIDMMKWFGNLEKLYKKSGIKNYIDFYSIKESSKKQGFYNKLAEKLIRSL